jgi:hypothetical protein
MLAIRDTEHLRKSVYEYNEYDQGLDEESCRPLIYYATSESEIFEQINLIG